MTYQKSPTNPEHVKNLEKLYHEKAIAVNRLYKREHVGEDVKRERIQAEMDLKAVGLFVEALIVQPRMRRAGDNR